MTVGGQNRGDFQLSAGFPIGFPYRKLSGSVGNKNHMTAADHLGTVMQQYGSTEGATTMPNFSPMGIMGPGFLTNFLSEPISGILFQNLFSNETLFCPISGYK